LTHTTLQRVNVSEELLALRMESSRVSAERLHIGEALQSQTDLFGEERVNVGFEDQWIDNFSMADRDPILRVADNSEAIPTED
jgi:hypothetical protein